MSDLYYMGRPVELVKHEGVIELFQYVSKPAGDDKAQANVFMALWSFWNFSHALDDVIDSGKLNTSEREHLLKLSADYLHAALMTPEQPDAVVWFKAAYIEALNRAEFTEADAKLAMKAFDDFTGNLLENPFYRRFCAQHLALLDSLIFRTLAGDEMAESDDPKRKALAPAVRCGDLDFIVHVAKLTGGWDHARKVSGMRDYDVPD